MVELDAMDHEIHKGYFELLKAEKPDDKKADSLQQKMQWIVNERNTATFDHFKKLRAICKPEQKVLFDQLIDEISRALNAGPGPQGLPPRE